MPFSSKAARMAFFKQLKLKGENPNSSETNNSSGLKANIMPKMPDISKIKLPKLSDSNNKSLKFKKLKLYMKGF